MARRRRPKRREAADDVGRSDDGASTSADGPVAGQDLSPDPRGVLAMRIGWAIAAIGAGGLALERGSAIGAASGGVLFAGALTAVGGRMFRDRRRRAAHEAAPSSPGSLIGGVLLLIAGFGALLYPAFATVEVFRALVEAYPFGPIVAVSLMGSGGALLIDHFDRPAPSEPPFAIPDPPGIVDKLLLLNPLQIPLWPFGLFMPWLRRWAPFPWWIYESWVELDREAEAEKRARLARSRTGYDWRPFWVFLVGGLLLTLMEYFGHAPTLRELVLEHAEPGNLWARLEASPFYHGGGRGPGSGLIEFAWWSLWRLSGFFLIPALLLRLLGERVSDHGLQTRGFFGHAWIYVLFFIPVLGLVGAVSYDEHFQTYYPFYESASRSWYDFWAWEALYAVQFFSLEFFFRGFWVKSGKSMMGSHVIYAMVVPYVMIHFGKPFLETIGATFAGLILGTLALRTRSIWAGFLIHVSVAISMDLAALGQTTGLPTRWWPSL